MTCSRIYYLKTSAVQIVIVLDITKHPEDTTVKIGATATFTVVASAADAGEGGKLSYQWQESTDGGNGWNNIQNATESSYTTPEVTYDYNGRQYRCVVTNTKDDVSSDPVYSNAAALKVIKLHQITFLKPTNDNDENNPVNINNGSLVLATVSGEEMSEVANLTIKVDGNTEEQITPSGNTIYYLLPANLSKGAHTITIKLTNTAGQEITESVTFHWNSYRRGFGFGRFDFGDVPAGE